VRLAKSKQQRDFRAVLQSIFNRHDLRNVFDAFVPAGPCALSMQTREAEYIKEAKPWTGAE
jgi:hypothetical protein